MTAEGGILLAAENVAVDLGGRSVVEGASFVLRTGECVILVGPNGAGKTTLVRALAGLVPSRGTILLGGEPMSRLDARRRARAVAYLPQGHVFHWPMPAAEIVALGRHPHADPFAPRSDKDRAAIARALEATGTRDFAARSVASLSGGERARVALARALATEAAVLLADEPTAALDPRHQLVVMGLLRKVARAGGGVLAIVHDLALAARFADRVLVMERGRIVADAPPDDALAPSLIADVFGVEATTVATPEGPVPMPWRPL